MNPSQPGVQSPAAIQDLLKQETVKLTLDLPISLDELLGRKKAASKRKQGKSISKREMIVTSLVYYFTTDLGPRESWDKSKLTLEIIKSLDEPLNLIPVDLSVASALRLHDILHEKIPEVVKLSEFHKERR